ncbi:MAG TPA: PfkB family carbohydrate kinase [Patescibacteria group bacterium]|nr:PfkB family carbohydrate kinase [Patescibacteria group bacterium]
MKNHVPTVAFLGDLTADVYKSQNTVKLGGAALNSAIWAKRLGANPIIFSAAGDDAMGVRFIKEMGKRELDGSSVKVIKGETSSIEIFVNGSGERQYGVWKPGVLPEYHIDETDSKKLKHADAVCVTIYPQYFHVLYELRRVKPRANNRKKPFVVVNFGDMKEFHDDVTMVRDSMGGVDMLVFGLDKDRDEAMINTLKDVVPKEKLLLITLGSSGSVAWYRGIYYAEPSLDVTVKDTTGAGDAYLVGFLLSFLASKNIQTSLHAGSRQASQVIQKIGTY